MERYEDEPIERHGPNQTRKEMSATRKLQWSSNGRGTEKSGNAHEVTRRSAAVSLLAFAVFGVLGLTSGARAAAGSAEAFVQSGIEKSYAILNNSGLSASERQTQFRAFLSSIVDIRRVALFTLGQYARNVAEGDDEKFELAFADFLTAVYQRGLSSYVDPKVTGSMERARDDVIVNVMANTANGKTGPAQLAFRVRRGSNGQYVVTDMQVEGAWLAILQRAEFTAYLQQHNANIGALAMELQDRTARIRVARSDGEFQQKR